MSILDPVRAGLVPTGPEYEWSSAAAHCADVRCDPLLDAWTWSELVKANDWADVLQAGVPDDTASRLRQATDSGAPLGDLPSHIRARGGSPWSC